MYHNDKAAQEIVEKAKITDINGIVDIGGFTDVIPVSRGLLETAIAVALSDRDALHESRRRECVGAVLGALEKRKTWEYAGGAGYDTEHYAFGGFMLTVPGIKQIVMYGIKNEEWWTKYFFKWRVLKPRKYLDDGWNAASAAAEDAVEEWEKNNVLDTK